MILEREQMRPELVVEIRQRNTVIAAFPRTRRWWLAEDWKFLEQNLTLDRQLTALDLELDRLRLEERRMYEEELRRAEADGGRSAQSPAKPCSASSIDWIASASGPSTG